MTERGILMKAAMAHGANVGTKTNTLRILSPQPVRMDDHIWAWKGGAFALYRYPSDSTILSHCPYGKVGDRLWIRETWGVWDGEKLDRWPLFESTEIDSPEGASEDEVIRAALAGRERLQSGYTIKYRAEEDSLASGGWRPSLFMPRWASRTTVEIDALRVHRVQEITDIEALREGIRPMSKDGKLVKYGLVDLDGTPGGCDIGWKWQDFELTPQLAYARLWDSINAKPKPVLEAKKVVGYISYPWANISETREYRGLPWKIIGNPWVWGISFKRVEGEEA